MFKNFGILANGKSQYFRLIVVTQAMWRNPRQILISNAALKSSAGQLRRLARRLVM
jgi:hypothetical protein